MTRKYLHPSLILAYAFLAFWLGFAVKTGVQEAKRVAGDFPNIRKEGVLRVCGEKDLFSFYPQNDSVSGFYYEMMKAFADRHGLKLIYLSESSLSARLNLLDDNACDVLSGPLPVVSELRNRLTYTRSILESKLVLVQRKNEDEQVRSVVRNQIDFSGKRIHLCDNPAHMQRLRHLAAEISDTLYLKTLYGFDSERLLAQVSSGLIDYAVCDKQVAKAYRKRFENLDVETPVGFNQMQAWAVKPGRRVLLDSLNVFIDAYKKSPEFSRLLKKYIAD